jgi:predicted nucleic acid-binding protein
MIVVSDASPIITLSSIGQLHLLKLLYSKVLIPHAVFSEIAEVEKELPGARELAESDWIIARDIKDRILFKALIADLDAGESEAIVLAVESNAKLFLADERRARNIATRLGINVIGVAGILIEAKSKNLIPEVKPLLNGMIKKSGFRISKELYKLILNTADEK